MVVIAIVGLLSAIIIVALGSARDSAVVASGKTFAGNSRTALYDDTVAYIDFDDGTPAITGKITGLLTLNSSLSP
jgi:type II secretory pathway pseudopilin PulG